MAVAGFVLSFFYMFSVLGLVFSCLGLSKANKLPSKKGKGLAIAGIVLSGMGLALMILVLVTVLNGSAASSSINYFSI